MNASGPFFKIGNIRTARNTMNILRNGSYGESKICCVIEHHVRRTLNIRINGRVYSQHMVETNAGVRSESKGKKLVWSHTCQNKKVESYLWTNPAGNSSSRWLLPRVGIDSGLEQNHNASSCSED